MDKVVYQLTGELYLSDCRIRIRQDAKITHIQANTGAGKSTFAMEVLSRKTNIIFAVPQRAQVAQLENKYGAKPNVCIVHGDNKRQAIPKEIMVCTYDQLSYVQSLLDPSEYTLVVDEIHKIYQAANYRSVAIEGLLEAITSNAFKRVITLSATFTAALAPFTIDHWIIVEDSKAIERDIELKLFRNRDTMEDDLFNTLVQADASGGPFIVRINSTDDINAYRRLLESKGLRCLAISRGVQNTDAVKSVIQQEQVKGYDVILTTCLLDEAININDFQIAKVIVFNDRIHPEELKQFVGRFRRCNPPIGLYLTKSHFRSKTFDLSAARKSFSDAARGAVSLAKVLPNDLSVDERCLKMNQTLRPSIGFPPITLKHNRLVINECAISNALYRLDLDNHYSSESTLKQAIEDQFEELSFKSSRLVDCDADSENDELLEDAYAEVEQAKQELLNECWNEYEAYIEEAGDIDGQSLQALDYLCSFHPSGTSKSDIYRRWYDLHRTVLRRADEAFDALFKGRNSEVWTFFNSANDNLFIQPILHYFMENVGVGTRLTIDSARQHCLSALKEVSKKHPEFKRILAASNVPGLKVKNNNHFDVSNSFILALFRKYTPTGPVKSNNKYKLVFDGVGPYNYDYSIPNVYMRKTPVQPVQRRARKLRKAVSRQNAA